MQEEYAIEDCPKQAGYYRIVKYERREFLPGYIYYYGEILAESYNLRVGAEKALKELKK